MPTPRLNPQNASFRRASRALALAVAPALALCFMSCLEPIRAAQQVSLTAVQGSAGATVQVPLTLSGVTNQAPAVALQADIVFDARSLVSSAATKGNLLPGHVLATSSRLSGTRRMLIYSMNNAPLPAGVIANFPFSISSATHAGSFPLLLTNVILANAAAGPVASTVTSGSIILGVLNPILARPDGNVDVFLNAGPGQPYILQASTNFVQWVNIFTNTALVDILPLTDQDAHLYPYRFYRAVPTSIPSGVVLSGVTLGANGMVSFQVVVAQAGKWVLQGSANLTTWVNLQTNSVGAGPATFTDPAAVSFSARFYRLLSQ
jgi:hypothetical protein